MLTGKVWGDKMKIYRKGLDKWALTLIILCFLGGGVRKVYRDEAHVLIPTALTVETEG